MTTWSDAFSARTDHLLELVLTEASTNSSANTSSVTATLQINPPSDSVSWNGYGDSTYSLTFEGSTYTGSYSYDFRSDRSTQVLRTVTKTVTHAANGTGDAQASASADAGSGTLGSASISTKTLTLTDFVRLPSAPSAPTLTRNSAGTTITVVSATASSAVTLTDYDMRYSTNQSTWTTVAIGTDKTGTFTAVATTTYYVQTRGVSSEGDGAWSSSASIVGIPTAPASISAVRSSRDITVTAGSSTGSGITGYKVQYSTDDGSTWSTAQAMTSQAYTYTSLTPALTYLFRVYSTNSIGNSANTTTESGTFVPAGGKRWDGTTFTPTSTAQRYNGTAWVEITTAKRYNGTEWVDLS